MRWVVTGRRNCLGLGFTIRFTHWLDGLSRQAPPAFGSGRFTARPIRPITRPMIGFRSCRSSWRNGSRRVIISTLPASHSQASGQQPTVNTSQPQATRRGAKISRLLSPRSERSLRRSNDQYGNLQAYIPLMEEPISLREDVNASASFDYDDRSRHRTDRLVFAVARAKSCHRGRARFTVSKIAGSAPSPLDRAFRV